MDYEYTMSGGVRAAGCAAVTLKVFRYYKFSPGTTLYLCYKAARGVLERVTIKKIIAVSNHKTGHRVVPLYKDTYNALYNEYDLCTEADAIVLATAYYEKRLAETNALMAKCINGG